VPDAEGFDRLGPNGSVRASKFTDVPQANGHFLCRGTQAASVEQMK
jgi:hypothetical protein